MEQIDIFYYRIVVETDSDWTEVAISGGPSGVAANYTFIQGSEAPQLMYLIESKSIVIGKTLGDTTKVTIAVDILATRGEQSGIITIKKGDLGSTRVLLYAYTDFINPLWSIYSFFPNPEFPGTNDRVYTVDFSDLYDDKLGTAEYYAKSKQFASQVFTFYYPWYASPYGPSQQWSHWEDASHENIANSAHYPLLGVYDSKDKRVIAAQITMAQHAGIDGFIVSWWGVNDFTDQTLSRILSVAEQYDFKITIYYESIRGEEEELTVQDVITELTYIIQTYAQNPAFLKIDGIPVMFIYAVEAYERTPDFWFQVRQGLESIVGSTFLSGDCSTESYHYVFDSFHTYIQLNPLEMQDIYEKYTERMGVGLVGQTPSEAIDALAAGNVIQIREKVSCYTVVPGYDDTTIRYPGFILDRSGGETYGSYWEDAIASAADWVLITSWNELHEGTEIEPSREYGFTYLNVTRRYIEDYTQTAFPLIKADFSSLLYPFELYPDLTANGSIVLNTESILALLVNVELIGEEGVSELELEGDVYTYLNNKNATYISTMIPSIQPGEPLELQFTFTTTNTSQPVISIHITAYDPSGMKHELFYGKIRVSDQMKELIEQNEALKEELTETRSDLKAMQIELIVMENQFQIWQLFAYAAIISATVLGIILITIILRRR